MFDPDHDARVRTAAFRWLDRHADPPEKALRREVLARGFIFGDTRVPLVGPQGIFKPAVLQEVPLSITTSPNSPYDDAFGPDQLLRYRYRGTNPNHPDNQGLRLAMQRQLPLVYLHGALPNRYSAVWPVFVVADHPEDLAFSVVVDEPRVLEAGTIGGTDAMLLGDDQASGRRAYITSLVRTRLHQTAFRERVLHAYRRQCAFCRLRHEELLDAAHIIPDSHPEGEPYVRNGLSLCALHHTAFDRSFVGVRPDHVIEVRPDILHEEDGPTLVHAIQALHGTSIVLPGTAQHRPDPELLDWRYQEFRHAQRRLGGL